MIDSAAGSGRRRSRPGRAGDRHLARSGGDEAGPAGGRPIDGRSVAPIGDAKPRIAGCFGGNVCRLVVHPLSGTPTFEVQLDDGTGRSNALFLGRRGIAGMWCGRQLVIAGTPVAAPRGLPVYNPEYQLIP